MRIATIIGGLAAILLAGHGIISGPSAEAWGTQVFAHYSCYYGKVTATLTWTGNSPYAVGQYVEMSYTDNGWQPHTTTSVGPFHPWVNTMAWDGLQASTRHFLRFTQQYPDGSWDASLTFRFDTPSCGADGFTPTFLSLVPGAGPIGYINLASLPPGPPPGPVDYDCAGGPGDGPLYVQGPVDVSAGDPHRLDADGDRIGCEPGEF